MSLSFSDLVHCERTGHFLHALVLYCLNQLMLPLLESCLYHDPFFMALGLSLRKLEIVLAAGRLGSIFNVVKYYTVKVFFSKFWEK
jgi:hypothetical protein